MTAKLIARNFFLRWLDSNYGSGHLSGLLDKTLR